MSTSALLRHLTRHPSLQPSELSALLGIPEKDVIAAIRTLVKTGKLAGYKAVINTNSEKNTVTAMVEVKVATRRGKGFDDIAERIARYPEVVSCYLMSGSHDLNVQVKGKTLHDVASFISQKLATLEDVLGTQTHFILKKYKEDNVTFFTTEKDTRLKVS